MWACAGISYNNVEQPCVFHPQRCAVKARHASSAESTNGMKPCVVALTADLHDIGKIKNSWICCKIPYIHVQDYFLYFSYEFKRFLGDSWG